MFSLTKESTSVKATENLAHEQNSIATQSLSGQHAPVPSLSIEGDDNTIDVKVEPEPYRQETTFGGGIIARARSTDMFSHDLKTYLPWGISLILLAAGIMAILYALKAARRSSAAVDASFGAADTALANTIKQLRSRVAAGPDPAIQSTIADLEADRGKLGKAKREAEG